MMIHGDVKGSRSKLIMQRNVGSIWSRQFQRFPVSTCVTVGVAREHADWLTAISPCTLASMPAHLVT